MKENVVFLKTLKFDQSIFFFQLVLQEVAGEFHQFSVGMTLLIQMEWTPLHLPTISVSRFPI